MIIYPNPDFSAWSGVAPLEVRFISREDPESVDAIFEAVTGVHRHVVGLLDAQVGAFEWEGDEPMCRVMSWTCDGSMSMQKS